MLKACLLALAAAGLVLTSHAAKVSELVVSYQPGSGFVPNYTDPSTALGDVSRVNPFGEATDPFDPPYGTNQIVSLGAGGSLVLFFQKPIHNHPHNPHGLDFVIFGNSGFIITNEFDFTTFNWIGTPATDGSLFAQSTGDTRVSVSRDGVTFYQLDPALAPAVDRWFPTDGAGDPRVPLDPALRPADFAGATLDNIRTLYDDSAGGAAYDISWARDARGRRVHLPEIHFIRIDVLSGKAEIDAISEVARPRGHGPKRAD